MKIRDLSISSRKEETLESYVTKYVKFELGDIKKIFDEDINSINSMQNFISKNDDDVKKQLVYQSQIVLLESTFDYYLHNISKYGATRIYNRNWESTTKYENITIDLKTFERVMNSTVHNDWFTEYISEYYSKITMVSYESFKDQMNLIGINVDEIASIILGCEKSNKSDDRNSLKQKIDMVYKKRNVIAHQFQRSHLDASRELIEKADVEEFVKDIVAIVNAIQLLASRKS